MVLLKGGSALSINLVSFGWLLSQLSDVNNFNSVNLFIYIVLLFICITSFVVFFYGLEYRHIFLCCDMVLDPNEIYVSQYEKDLEKHIEELHKIFYVSDQVMSADEKQKEVECVKEQIKNSVIEYNNTYLNNINEQKKLYNNIFFICLDLSMALSVVLFFGVLTTVCLPIFLK